MLGMCLSDWHVVFESIGCVSIFEGIRDNKKRFIDSNGVVQKC